MSRIYVSMAGWLMLIPVFLFADTAEKKPQVPPSLDFVRTLDIEGGAFSAGHDRHGAQFFRLETRYRDPDVNAFVGLLTTITRFNDELNLGSPTNLMSASILANWGAAIGIVRGAHLWALDLMGASLGDHLAFGPAIVGEHTLGPSLKLYHRTTIDLFNGDTLLDADQGLMWSPWPSVGFMAGYRIFAAQHTSRNGPRVGILLHFESPKIPFLFPSMG